ncbi:MAG: aminotransferase class I/II-fold pyridoxal phosphate-dependent enzyme [Oscillospiraceae bacterium]|nr:aminotransferase class I/II-fold pyridoxal phosphate-dependent enzyme [Oscillospiraceae bacterium]
MQALMLAAGMGKRLGAYTNNQTKCMVKVGGYTLLEHAAEALRQAGIRRFVIVVGYEGEKLKAFAREKLSDFDLVFVENPDYATTNNIYSLYLAREELMADDTVLLESDLIYDPSLIRRLVEAPEPNMVAVAKYEQWMDGTVTLVDEDGLIREFIEKKDFSFASADTYYKTVNVYKFSREFSTRQYVPFMMSYLQAYGANQYYEMVLKALAHLPFAGLRAFKMGDLKWYEIDDVQDLDIANTIFARDEDRLHAYELHFGGYWRFDGLKDFCYLVNPYFPPKKMLEQMQYSYSQLLTSYPSGMYVQKLMAGKMFGIRDELVLVGNGAAELINTLGRTMRGRTGLSIPAFNEYVRCFPDCEIVPIQARDYGFQFDMSALRKAAAEMDNLVIINPDNPSGSFLKREEILELADICREHGTTFVVDESFVDFAEAPLRFTLLDNDILDAYPNLMVIKSISKSYGVPGLRLGVAASGNTAWMEQLRGLLPIWNINSFGEYFFQIVGLYSGEYRTACNKIVRQREKMEERLGAYAFLTPYPSQANYIMCRVEGIGSKELANRLLRDDNLLIKDLSTKNGFGGADFIRVAVRDEADNEALYQALEKIKL